MKKEMPGKKMMPAFMDQKAKKMANGGKVMKYADGGKVSCGHRGGQDYGKKK